MNNTKLLTYQLHPSFFVEWNMNWVRNNQVSRGSYAFEDNFRWQIFAINSDRQRDCEASLLCATGFHGNCLAVIEFQSTAGWASWTTLVSHPYWKFWTKGIHSVDKLQSRTGGNLLFALQDHLADAGRGWSLFGEWWNGTASSLCTSLQILWMWDHCRILSPSNTTSVHRQQFLKRTKDKTDNQWY